MVNVCPELLAKGVCETPGCRKKHDVHICRDCGVVSESTHNYHQHLAGRSHRRKVAGLNGPFFCKACSISVQCRENWVGHVNGRRHRTNCAHVDIDVNAPPEEVVDVEGHIYCNVCRAFVLERNWARHPSTPIHQRKTRFAKLEAAFADAAKDKHGISVSHHPDGLDFGVVAVEDAGSGIDRQLTVKSAVPLAKISLIGLEVTRPFRQTSPFSLHAQNIDALPRPVVYGRDIILTVQFRQSNLGLYNARVELTFQDTALHQKFVIVREVRAIVGDQAEYDKLRPVAPFLPKPRVNRAPATDVIPGPPPPALANIPYIVKLPLNLIPAYVSHALSRGTISSIVSHFQNSLLPRHLDSSNHGRHYKYLLWAEEYRSEQDLQMYDIENVQLRMFNHYYYLEVPGLAEKRPSVLVGDSILVQPVGSPSGRWFEGHVHVVRQKEVGLKFHASFNVAARYRIRFRLNRYPLRRQHQALDIALHSDRILFPSSNHVRYPVAPVANLNTHITASIHNRLIASNPAQLQAVTSIVKLPPGSLPFVIFGPPGTGKTVTIVEAIRQVLDTNPNAKILACAPSNSAADLIASRLSMLKTDQLFRFYAPSRHKSDVPDELLPYSSTTSLGHFSVPPMATMKRFRVIVSTCVSASFAYGIGMPRGHFSHIFVDEAGHATEPDVMISVKTMADNDTNIVLSGDPKQLGPIIRSGIARELGLEKSYLERLMESRAYDERVGRGKTVVKLVHNFRSHPSILDFPNKQFYRNELESYGDRKVINAYIDSPHLINKKFPIIFHALCGKDEREAASPSFFNILEILQVKKYVEKLKGSRDVRITDADIGVIAPYHAQCLKIRSTLRAFADGVKVGSVEEFQGQERKVIIISTVRSSREYVEYDLKHTLGFVANPRRLNVSITRAKSLLIIVGDPTVLSLDPLWRSFLNYIYDHGGWTGDPDGPSWDPEEDVTDGYDEKMRDAGWLDLNDFARRMESLTLRELGNQNGDGGEEDGDDGVDRPWRDVE
ncbi:DNA2/NAM7 helicase family protein [Abortiporus biennis]